jgi:hypothetical protein
MMCRNSRKALNTYIIRGDGRKISTKEIQSE